MILRYLIIRDPHLRRAVTVWIILAVAVTIKLAYFSDNYSVYRMFAAGGGTGGTTSRYTPAIRSARGWTAIAIHPPSPWLLRRLPACPALWVQLPGAS